MVGEVLEKLTVWALFSVGLALIPILFDAVRATVAGGTASFDDAIARGELALVTAAICGAAVGELLGVGGEAKLAKIVAGGCALLTLLFCAFFYTEVSAASRRGVAISKAIVRNFSVVLFLVGCVCSGACVALSRVV